MAQIRRAIDWIGKVFNVRGPRTSPVEILDSYVATFDAFGSHRLAEMSVESFSAIQGGAPGALEAAHTRVPDGFWRYYFSCEYSHDNAAAQILSVARVIQTGGGFPIARVVDEATPATDFRLAVRDIPVGPTDFLTVQGRVIPAATTISAVVAFIQIPLGESFRI